MGGAGEGGVAGDAEGGFAVVGAPAAVGTAPVVGLEAAVGVAAGGGECHECRKVVENACEERSGGGGEFPGGFVAGEDVLSLLPEAEVEVATAACLVGEEFGQEGGAQVVAVGDGVDGFAEGDLLVGGLEGVGVADGEFVLPVSGFGVVAFDADALGDEGGGDVVDDGVVEVDRPRGGEGGGVGGDGVIGTGMQQVKLVFKGGHDLEAEVFGLGQHSL